MNTTPMKTGGVDTSPEEVALLTDRLREYGTVIGKPCTGQDQACYDAAAMIDALSTALTASEKRANRYRAALVEIADTDYRGNRSVESTTAFQALQEPV